MWIEPSRVFGDDDICEGPGLKEIDAHMPRVFPGMLEVDVTDSMLYYLRSGGVKNVCELFVTRIRSRACWRRRAKRQLSHRWPG